MRACVGLPKAAQRLLAMFELNDRGEGTRRSRLILVHTHNGEFVVSAQYRSEGKGWDESWAQGHYFDNLEEARDYFVERCKERG